MWVSRSLAWDRARRGARPGIRITRDQARGVTRLLRPRPARSVPSRRRRSGGRRLSGHAAGRRLVRGFRVGSSRRVSGARLPGGRRGFRRAFASGLQRFDGRYVGWFVGGWRCGQLIAVDRRRRFRRFGKRRPRFGARSRRSEWKRGRRSRAVRRRVRRYFWRRLGRGYAVIDHPDRGRRRRAQRRRCRRRGLPVHYSRIRLLALATPALRPGYRGEKDGLVDRTSPYRTI